jgi:hypothetical protein
MKVKDYDVTWLLLLIVSSFYDVSLACPFAEMKARSTIIHINMDHLPNIDICLCRKIQESKVKRSEQEQ